jgi:hypothetical protein
MSGMLVRKRCFFSASRNLWSCRRKKFGRIWTRTSEEIADRDPFHANGIRKYRVVPWQVNEGSFAAHSTLSDGTVDFR